ncbi:helix-turn-helix transcriptional regulator [Rhizobium leguminosarum bv. trifolii]|nr:helix-turn-helix transcriptional regulator [Rhizobium leguminosarum bv. trifolii]QIO81856.1 helix-turn-helix transcriptional regulator [Rhizobium leguminosarum bv. trifolii]
MPSAEILRAARALLGWNQRQLATAADVSRPTVNRLENRQESHGEDRRESKDNPKLESIDAIVRAYQAQGIEFMEATSSTGAGVRWRTPLGRIGEDPTPEEVEKKL